MFKKKAHFLGGDSSEDLLLDLYQNAQFAYSLRKLKKNVINVIQVLRTGDNVLLDFSPTEIIDGTLANWIGVGNDGYVRKWYDQSGNDINLEVLGNYNKIVENGVILTDNGKPYVNYTGNEDFSNYNLSNLAGLNSDYGTVFMVRSQSFIDKGVLFTASGGRYFGVLDSTSTAVPQSGLGVPFYYKNSLLINDPNRTDLHNNYVTGVDVLISAYRVAFLVNAEWEVKSIPNVYTSNTFTAPSKLKEFIVYNFDQTTNKTVIENNINTYYNIY